MQFWIVVQLLICSVVCLKGLRVNLQGKFQPAPFHLHLLESIAATDERLYAKAIYSLVNEDQDEAFLDDYENDQLLHSLIHDAAQLDLVNRSMADLKAQAKYYSPRIQDHFDHVPSVECLKDSFGSAISRRKGEVFSWLVAKDRIYCTPDDLFALQLTKKSDLLDQVLPFDRIIGSNVNAPLLILYGDLNAVGFKSMFSNLYQSADLGKLRFVWRYIPTKQGSPELLPNYLTSLTLKNPVVSGTDSDGKGKTVDSLSPNSLKSIGLNLASYILNLRGTSLDKFNTLRSTLNDLPVKLSALKKVPIDNNIAANAASNENMGISETTTGIYLNGAPVNGLELDVFNLYKRIEDEASTIKGLMELGFNLDQARTLLTKFALHRAVKLSEYNSGGDENRYELYQNAFTPKSQFKKGGVVFLNNIETDENYLRLSTSRYDAYSDLTSNTNPGQIPLLRENVHDLVFVVNFSNKEQVKVFFTYAKIILDNSIPQQIGILPLAGNDLDKKLAKYFYFLYDTTTPAEALAFLYKAYMRESNDELEEIFASIPIGAYQLDEEVYLKTAEKFAITEPTVVFNGIIVDLKVDWRKQMVRQLHDDVLHLRKATLAGEVGDSMKEHLYKTARPKRNLKVTPKDSSGFIFKRVEKSLIDASVSFSLEEDIVLRDSIEIWIVGNLRSKNVLNQFYTVLRLMRSSEYQIQVRVLDTSTSKFLEKLQSGVLNEKTLDKVMNNVVKELSNEKQKQFEEDIEKKKLLSGLGLPSTHSFMLVNSRYFRIDEPLTLEEVHDVCEFEFQGRVHLIDSFMAKYPEIFNGLALREFYDKHLGLSFNDWHDLMISKITKSFHVDQDAYFDDVARFDFASINIANSFVIDNEEEPLIDILVIMDPLLGYSQEIITILESCVRLPFVRTRILIQPKSEYDLPPTRILRGSIPSYPLKFDTKGFLIQQDTADFETVPVNEAFSLDVIAPKRWTVVPKFVPSIVDTENLLLSDYNGADIEITYELSSILIEGYARDVSSILPPEDVVFILLKNGVSHDTPVMANLGYFQLKADSGTWFLSIGSTGSKNYKLLSASSNTFDYTTSEEAQIPVNVFTLDGLVLRPRLSQSTDIVHEKKASKDINIFSIASGHLYEKLMSVMMLSIKSNTKSLVKFWLIENYLSPKFKASLPLLSETYDFNYEFVSYKWPIWLRSQKTRQRSVWAYKILFLDALFPTDLDQVIFVDADQINRFDMQELKDLDMGDAPYGFVPMCDSKKEMDGFRFWKQGYWKDALKDDLKYHISALYKVNLHRFRDIKAGDRLRSHYQKLSSDQYSLSNLDQDLPNNMQRSIPIFSLPQEFLWCDTWCSEDTLTKAKNIDLCNNPLTKEDKLSVAKRLVPEWSDLFQKASQLDITIPSRDEFYKDLTDPVTDEFDSPDTELPDYDFDHDEL